MESISWKLKAGSKGLKAWFLSLFSIGLGSCFLILGSISFANAQSFSFSDLFGQGEKDIKNMAAQVEALNAFISSARQGYNMLHSEWSMIGNWKNGELGMHQAYYTSLGKVNTVVKNDPDVGSIQSEQLAILGLFSALGGLPGLLPYEQAYVQSVSANLLSGCNADLEALQQVLGDGKLTMSDDERLKQISKLQTDMLDRYRFAQGFCNSVRLLVMQRNSENNEMLNLNSFYGDH